MESFFDRNSASRGWNQDFVSRQVALVLGVGGLGNSLCMSLCRLGFERIYIVDKDIVETSNLNRQMLFTKADVGQFKTVSAQRSLEEGHNINSTIQVFNICALERWDIVVELAKSCTCIFNTIDHGDYFDFAVSSLAWSLKIPMVDGGTDPVYGSLFSTTLSKCKQHEACWSCFNDLEDKELCTKLSPNAIQGYSNINFVPPDPRDDSKGSNVFTATACSQFMVAVMMEYLMPRSESPVPERVICRLLSFDLDKFHCEKSQGCLICGKVER
jgi:molybdopterin/thiamine biosynthesis adenylyltransferase